MAKDKLKKRARKALRKELRRRTLRPVQADELGPSRIERDWETGPDDDPTGGAGVREPRHPSPTRPAAAIELAEPELQYLDLAR